MENIEEKRESKKVCISKTQFSDLPYDCITHVLLFIHTRHIFNLRLTSPLFNNSILNRYSWSYRTLTLFGNQNEKFKKFSEHVSDLSKIIQPVKIRGCQRLFSNLTNLERLSFLELTDFHLDFITFRKIIPNIKSLKEIEITIKTLENIPNSLEDVVVNEREKEGGLGNVEKFKINDKTKTLYTYNENYFRIRIYIFIKYILKVYQNSLSHFIIVNAKKIIGTIGSSLPVVVDISDVVLKIMAAYGGRKLQKVELLKFGSILHGYAKNTMRMMRKEEIERLKVVDVDVKKKKSQLEVLEFKIGMVELKLLKLILHTWFKNLKEFGAVIKVPCDTRRFEDTCFVGLKPAKLEILRFSVYAPSGDHNRFPLPPMTFFLYKIFDFGSVKKLTLLPSENVFQFIGCDIIKQMIPRLSNQLQELSSYFMMDLRASNFRDNFENSFRKSRFQKTLKKLRIDFEHDNYNDVRSTRLFGLDLGNCLENYILLNEMELINAHFGIDDFLGFRKLINLERLILFKSNVVDVYLDFESLDLKNIMFKRIVESSKSKLKILRIYGMDIFYRNDRIYFYRLLFPSLLIFRKLIQFDIEFRGIREDCPSFHKTFLYFAKSIKNRTYLKNLKSVNMKIFRSLSTTKRSITPEERLVSLRQRFYFIKKGQLKKNALNVIVDIIKLPCTFYFALNTAFYLGNLRGGSLHLQGDTFKFLAIEEIDWKKEAFVRDELLKRKPMFVSLVLKAFNMDFNDVFIT